MLQELFSAVYIPVLVLIFFGVLYGFPKFVSRIRTFLGGFDKRYIVLLFLLVSGSFFVRGFMTENTKIRYSDEFDYMATARNFVEKGRMELCSRGIDGGRSCDLNLKSSGYSFLVGLSFLIGGVRASSPLWMNVILGSMTVFLTGLLAWQFYGSRAGVFTAFLSSLFWTHIKWSSTAEKTVSAIFFSFLFLNAAFFLREDFDIRLLIFTTASYVFAGLIRPEFFVFLFPVFVVAILPALRSSEMYSVLVKRIITVFSVIIGAIGIITVYFELFRQGTGGLKNIQMFGFSNLVSNMGGLLDTFYGSLFLVLVTFLLVYIVLKEDNYFFSFLFCSSVLHLVTVLLYGNFGKHYLIFSAMVTFVFLSDGFSDISYSGTFGHSVAVLLVVLTGIFMFQQVSYLNLGDYTEYDRYISGKYGGCTLVTGWDTVFALEDNVTVISRESLGSDFRLLEKKVSEGNVLVLGEPVSLPDTFEQKLIESNKYYRFSFDVYNLTVR